MPTIQSLVTAELQAMPSSEFSGDSREQLEARLETLLRRLRLHAATDPHSPPIYRINGVVVNMPQFAKAFACDADAAMVKKAEEICEIW